MRKLSKKISMLMVLAMLVSLFSGVVSASAASSWSFYNKTDDAIVEVKDSIEMESNQFADFDLYKDGKAFDTDVYTVKYVSSDEDVVWVDAKNGKLRADKYGKAEAGDKAVVSAKIENKNTGAKTTKSFTIVIAEEEVEVEYAIVSDIADEPYLTGEKYALAAKVTADGEAVEAEVAFTVDGAAITEFAPAKAGEYTIVATATIDDEVVATEKFVVTVEESVPEVVAAKQTALNTVEITFNNADWAKDFAGKVKLSYFAGDVEIADLVKSAVAKDEIVTVTLYNNLAADINYKFAYEGYDCAATVKGAKSEPASIKVVGGNVAVGAEGDLAVKFYTADGIDITTDDLKAQVQYAGTDESISIVAGQKIYFFEAGKAAVVNATYDMGYDDNGNEIADLKASGMYYSVPAHTDSNLNGFAADNTAAANSNLTYGNSITISLSDSKFLHAKFTRTPAQGNASQIYVAGGNDTAGKTTYTYYSTNESVLLVNSANGALTPCSEGVASVYLKDANNTVVGSVAVTVKGYRGLNSFTASMTDRMVSAGDAYTDTTTISVTAKDQLGDAIVANWAVEIVNPAGVIGDYFDITYLKADGTVATNGVDVVTGVKLTPNASAIANIAATKTKVVTFKIKATVGNVEKTWNGSVTIKNINTVNPASTVLEVSPATVDMKLNKTNADDYNVTAKLVKKDADRYDLGLQAYTYITSEAAAVTDNGAYSIIVKKNAETAGQNATGIIANAGNKITFTPVTGDATVTKTTKDTYTIKVFKGNGTKAQLYATKTVSFTDSTTAITVVVNNTNVDINDSAALKAAMDFYRGATKINDKIESVVVPGDGVTATVNYKAYVKKIQVTVSNSEMNNDFAGNHVEEATVNQLFTVQ